MDADSAYINNYNIIPLNEIDKPNPANGSNNWAVSGSRTKSGKPILANDPHLELTLPSVWFEMQLHAWYKCVWRFFSRLSGYHYRIQ